MAKYWFKDGKLPKSLQKESVEKAPLLEEEEVQAAFFTGEDSTKVFDSSSVSKDEALGELFGVEEPKKKKGKVKLSAFIGKNVDGDTSEKIIKEVDEVYSGEYVKKIDETTIAVRPNNKAMESAILAGELELIAGNLCNVFDPVVTAEHLELNYIKSLCNTYGAMNQQMTGSGSAVFAIMPNFEYAAVLCGMLKDNYPQVYIAKPV